MKKTSYKSLLLSFATAGLLGCSGGGSSGGGSGTSSSMLQVNKMTCGGSACIGTGSASLLNSDMVKALAAESAVALYNNFNTNLIPALNRIISVIEEGAGKAGAESCSDIQPGGPFIVNVQNIDYNVKATSSSETAPAAFTTASMAIGLYGQIVSSNFNAIQADVSCGNGTNASPLVGRVLARENSDALNAWYEKGASNHTRLLMIAKASGTVYASWFKTDDGDSFEFVLASAGQVYKATGKKSLGSIKFRDHAANDDTCINATTGESAANCNDLPGTVTINVIGVPASLTGNGDVAWGSISDSATLQEPTF